MLGVSSTLVNIYIYIYIHQSAWNTRQLCSQSEKVCCAPALQVCIRPCVSQAMAVCLIWELLIWKTSTRTIWNPDNPIKVLWIVFITLVFDQIRKLKKKHFLKNVRAHVSLTFFSFLKAIAKILFNQTFMEETSSQSSVDAITYMYCNNWYGSSLNILKGWIFFRGDYFRGWIYEFRTVYLV